MNIAFIGFGKVAYTLSKLINSPDIIFSTSTENRSKDTIDLINKADIRIFDYFSDFYHIKVQKKDRFRDPFFIYLLAYIFS